MVFFFLNTLVLVFKSFSSSTVTGGLITLYFIVFCVFGICSSYQLEATKAKFAGTAVLSSGLCRVYPDLP